MKKITLLFFLSVFVSFSQEEVGIQFDTDHVYYSSNPDSLEVTYFKIYRNQHFTTSYSVSYTVSGAGVDNTDASNGSITFVGNEQFKRVKITPTSTPASDEILTVTLVDGPEFSIETNEGSKSITVLSEPLELAFEGAIGPGKYAGSRISPNTWRGKDVYKVTTLNDSGPGSFRDGMSNSNVGYIVFYVGGTIYSLNKYGTYGQSQAGKYITGVLAPAEGVLFRGDNINQTYFRFDETNDIVFRYISISHADPGSVGGDTDVFTLYQCQNVYVDHCFISHSDDETAGALGVTDPSGPYERATMTTYAMNHFSHGFYSREPSFENHSTLMMMGAIPDNAGRQRRAGYVGYLGFHYNLSTQISHRMPNFQSAILGESFNNVISNHRERLIQSGYPQPIVNWENNYIVPGPRTNSLSGGPFTAENPYTSGNKISKTVRNFFGTYLDGSNSLPIYYADGNVMKTNTTTYISEDDDDWAFFSFWFDPEFLNDPYLPNTETRLDTRFDMPYNDFPVPADSAYVKVLGLGGAGPSKRLNEDGSVTLRRNAWVQNLVNNVLNNTQGDYTESPEGWATDVPVYADAGSTIQDGDDDGMPDVWELSVGLESDISNNCASCTYNPNRQGPILDADGYKDNIEVFFDLASDNLNNGSTEGSPVPPTPEPPDPPVVPDSTERLKKFFAKKLFYNN